MTHAAHHPDDEAVDRFADELKAKLPAGQALRRLPKDDRARIEAVMRELRDQANTEAENAWRRRKGPMAAYWRAVSTYARHLAHALSKEPSK